jgi:hypothetical protein
MPHAMTGSADAPFSCARFAGGGKRPAHCVTENGSTVPIQLNWIVR